MISTTLRTLERGIQSMRQHTQFMLVGALVFIFPLLFIVVTQSFFSTAYSNIETVEKRFVNSLHDVTASLLTLSALTDEDFAAHVASLTSTNRDITALRIGRETPDGILVLHASEEARVGTYETEPELYRAAAASPGSSLIFKFSRDGSRYWQAFRQVRLESGETVYIFSEHSFATVDSIMLARQQESYFVLTAIFGFLILLAYWLVRQIDWHRRYQNTREQLAAQTLFTDVMAHELRAPLTAVKGYASFLQESPSLTPAEVGYATNIRSSADRLVKLIGELLEVSRLRAGSLSLTRSQVALADVFASVTRELAASAREKGLTLEARPTTASITTDQTRLTQVLANVVSNAIKYTPRGTVTLEAEEHKDGVSIRIKDTGSGISAEDQRKLFAPFSRVGDVDRSAITGSGLGLWITRELVLQLHGDIGVESIKGVGTHVVLRLPR